MRVTVLYFAGHREITGQSSEVLEIPLGATLADLWQILIERYPRLAAYHTRLLYAVNQEFAVLDQLLHDGDEVAFIPPVSGGSEPVPAFRITSAPIEPAPLVALVQSPAMGAIVTFAGVARNNFGGRATAYLEYEAFAPMAVRVLEDIAAEACARWSTGAIAIHHRIGRLAIGETAVLIVVAAPHRHEAFSAAEWIMDRIKERAPIWKKEHWADGASEWVGDEKERKQA
ncbi:MAG TPA: molybdopterin converting factor subunit 1 [Roseiflexaceae bacterium]|nr:molybdopterin converting factor subunit 1 [Roseiflexaceae bacterium]HMP39486.1 molybdopterin converting factor subunit 1 [Roseiflexaceae bacterium]